MVVWSSDEALRELAAGFSSSTAELQVVENEAEITAALDQPGYRAVLLDADPLQPAQLDVLLAALKRHPAAPIIIAAASKEPAKICMERLNVGSINRLLLKPASSGGLRLAVEYAVARCREGDTPASAAPKAEAQATGTSRLPVFIGGGALAAVLVLALVFFLRASPDPDPTLGPTPIAIQEPVAPAQPEPAAPDLALVDPIVVQPDDDADAPAAAMEESAEVDPLDPEPVVAVEPEPAVEVEELDEADAAEAVVAEAEADEPPAPREIDLLVEQSQARLLAGNLFAPEQNNALVFYQRAAAIDAGDAEVVALRARIAGAMERTLREALAAEAVEQAEQILAAGGTVVLSPTQLSALSAEIAQVEARLQAERQAALEQELLQTALARLSNGQLTEPEGDSAAFYLGRLRQENPAHPGLAEPFAELLATLSGQAGAAIDALDFDSADNAIRGLRQLDPDAGLVADLAASLGSARRQQDFLTTPAAQADVVILHMEPVVYPSVGLRRGIEGWVDVQLIVDRDGAARDVEVVAAQPEGTFDRAALNAVSRYRFEPFEFDGRVYDRLVELRLEFVLDG